jgi:hypothetical protein
METAPYKLRVTLGGSEFNSEGPETLVKEAYEKWLAAVTAQRSMLIATKEHKDLAAKSDSHGFEANDLQRLYDVDQKKGIVSLKHLPPESANRASDTAMLILYGFKKLIQTEDVPVTKLMAGLRQSGIHVTRLDGIMSAYSQCVLKGGSRIGGRYRLNNQGTMKAEELLGQYGA